MKNKSNSTAKELLCGALLLAMTFLATANAFAADGDLDLTFDGDGKVTTDFNASDDTGFAAAIQADGKIVVAGAASDISFFSNFAVARYNSNGSLDTSFSGDGKVTTDIFASDEASGAALQPDGKIVVVGKAQDSSNANNFAVVRYQSGGSAVTPRPHQFDFDGDGRDDLAVYRPSVGTWFVQRSQTGFFNQQFGASEDLIAPADYDGDRKTDIAVFRPSTGTWFRINSSNNQFAVAAFGQSGDLPRPGDYDGDGKADIAVFRPSTGVWYLLQSSAGFSGTSFGVASETPIPADYDGDGRSDIAVYRGGFWYLLRSTAGFSAVQFGAANDIPIPAQEN